MHAALHALPLALGAFSLTAIGRAQNEEARPPIFAPVPVPPLPAPVERTTPVPRVPISQRARQAMTDEILAAAKIFDGPIAAAATQSTPLTRADNGALVMQRFVVRALLPGPKEVEGPPRPVLLRFQTEDKWWSDPRTQPAQTLTLMEAFGGSIIFNVVNGAGQGVDHGRDFTRVELGFRKRF